MDLPPEPYDDGTELVALVFGIDPQEGDADRPACPDDGACHHECTAEDGCWRARHCSPLSAYGPTWASPPAGKTYRAPMLNVAAFARLGAARLEAARHA